MRRIGLILVVIMVTLSLVGCVRTSTYVKERVDQGPTGNRGYLEGYSPPEKGASQETTKTRKILNLEIELPPYLGWERFEKPDKEVSGNQGYISGRIPKSKKNPKK